ncbi:hypothetical protein E4U53_006876 [Claviceps sorghi]|nr:hypothetical protein E4U53_006876 [Claviceps sorghi]
MVNVNEPERKRAMAPKVRTGVGSHPPPPNPSPFLVSQGLDLPSEHTKRLRCEHFSSQHVLIFKVLIGIGLSRGLVCRGPQGELATVPKDPLKWSNHEQVYRDGAIATLLRFHTDTAQEVLRFARDKICVPAISEISAVEPGIECALRSLRTYMERAEVSTDPCDVVANQQRTSLDSQGVEQYTQANEAIMRLQGQPNHELSYVTSCAIFLAIEMIRGEMSSALGLLQNGLRLVAELDCNLQLPATSALAFQRRNVLGMIKSFFAWVKNQAVLAGQRGGTTLINS